MQLIYYFTTRTDSEVCTADSPCGRVFLGCMQMSLEISYGPLQTWEVKKFASSAR